MDEKEAVALMRYRIIAPLIDPDLKKGEKGPILLKISDKEYEHPHTKTKVMFSPETIRHWLKQYKKRGYEGLKSRTRSDKGSIKAIPTSAAQEAINLKLENPRRTVEGIITILETAGKIEKGVLKQCTLQRLFQRKKINIRKEKPSAVFGRFEADYPNDLWQSDIMFGLKLPDLEHPGKFFTPQLFAFIDDHSRVILHGQFYHNGITSHLEDCFKKAIQKRGIPKVVYVDNGQVFNSNQFHLSCAHLGIQLKFTRPYSPEGKGKVEKFFSYVRSSFLVEVEKSAIQTLDQLNQAFWAWLEIHYHQKIHEGIKESPIDRFTRHLTSIRRASEEDLKLAFMIKEKKKVHKDCTFQLKNRYYEVMPSLVHQEITIFYDSDDLDTVRVYLAGEFFQVANPIRISGHVAPKTQLPLPITVQTDYDHLGELIKAHANQKNEALLGPELVPVPSDNRFTKREFLTLLNKHGFHLNAFEEREITKFFDKFGPIQNPFATKLLEMTIEQCGISRHITFYLALLGGSK